MSQLLELRDVTCGYAHRPIVEQVSLTVSVGEVLCLLGPNGSGKTTLFKTILGLLPKLGGEILLEGQDLATWPRGRVARVMGYVPQAHVPPFPFAVIDAVLMGRTAHLGAFASPGRRDHDVAEQALAMLDVSHLRDRPYTQISGGERQLVLLARALAQQPRVLVMDEPTASLDFGHQVTVLGHIQRLAESGLAIVMATHFPDHALLYSSQVLLLKGGSVVNAGPPEEAITEESLRSLYGVDARIVDTGLRSHRQVRVCVPLGRQDSEPSRQPLLQEAAKVR